MPVHAGGGPLEGEALHVELKSTIPQHVSLSLDTGPRNVPERQKRGGRMFRKAAMELPGHCLLKARTQSQLCHPTH